MADFVLPLTQDLPPTKVQVLPTTPVLPSTHVLSTAQVQVLPPVQVHVLPPTQILPPAQVQFQPQTHVLPVQISDPFQRDFIGMLQLQHVNYLEMLSTIEEDNFELAPDTMEPHPGLPKDEINEMLADYTNKNVKLLNQQYKVVSHCGVAAYIEDICLITPSEVAVPVNEWGNTHSQLALGRKFQLQHICYGIAHHQGDMYITSENALYKYSLSHKQVCKLYEDQSGAWTVSRCAVSPIWDKLYITNYSHNKLLTLARDGTLLATLTDPELRQPRGLHVTPRGQVLVCGYLSDTILQVDSEGRKKLATLATGRDEVWYPESVCYCSTTSSIIVGHGDDILVFRVE
ncbi:hypothetical protein DPMN_144255 [Dreissena polymorpha]|uniref:Uncharacterized protein n=1 Tax=Dreissena polymorpha TaxID=45954 RepID=A0A9D4GEJ8_DREPO|nr:hypothetical protein DPMN_144255 [Dreissena polymorpha]